MTTSKPKILVTGGTGYIGSHTVVCLIESGYDPVIIDNLSNSTRAVLDPLETITGKRPLFYEVDLRDRPTLEHLFKEFTFSAVIHFAGLKAVGESVTMPLRYYENNVVGTTSLCSVMAERGVRTLIFSSSAAVYGNPETVPVREDASLAPISPYAHSKQMIEQILLDLKAGDPFWQIGLLRYFNPVGAHESGLIGEDPRGIPNNLMPYISQVATGRHKELQIFGHDYPTPDGTGVRDYIHVMDLAEGHVAALKHFENTAMNSVSADPLIVNLGTGRGYSVLEMVAAFQEAAGRKIPYRITERRPGDVAAVYADVSLAQRMLGWTARRDLTKMCMDAWRWQQKNPDGYRYQS